MVAGCCKLCPVVSVSAARSQSSLGFAMTADTGPALPVRIPVSAAIRGLYEVSAPFNAVVPIPVTFATPRGSGEVPDPNRQTRSISFANASDRMRGSSVLRYKESSKSSRDISVFIAMDRGVRVIAENVGSDWLIAEFSTRNAGVGSLANFAITFVSEVNGIVRAPACRLA